MHGTGIDAVWRQVTAFRQALQQSGELPHRRAEQAKAAMRSELRETMIEALKQHASVAMALRRLEDAVAAGRISPSAAAAELLQRFRAG